MANIVPSPNMNMPIPVVSVDPGPDWATNINASLSVVDGHNHSPGNGVQISPNGMNINADLSFGSNNAIALRTVRFTPQASPLSLSTDIGCLYESGVDLYYNDGFGNQIRITQSGSVSGSAGTITGLPSGTASASFSGSTFTFNSATNTRAAISGGPIQIALNTSGGAAVTLSPNSGQISNYAMTFPLSLPASTDYLTLDNAGNIGYNTAGSTGTGAVVLSTSPTFAGTVSGVISAGSFTPTTTFSGGAVIINSAYAYAVRINNTVTVSQRIYLTTSTASSATLVSTTIPVATSSLAVSGTILFIQTGETTGSVQALTNSGTTLVIVFVADFGSNFVMSGNSNGVINFDYSYLIV